MYNPQKPLKNSPISVQLFYRSMKIVTFEGVFVIGVERKRHNFGQCESFQGLVDIPRICLSWVSFGEGRTVMVL